MSDRNLKETTEHLFDRRWDEDLSDEEEEGLQDMFDDAIEKYGWEQVFDAIDQYMRTSCLTSESTVNFANLFWGYTCVNFRKISEPYRFLGYLYYMVGSEPWKYDCAEVYEGLVYKMLSGEDEYANNPFTNLDYIPEKDPCIIAEIEKLRNENSTT